MLRPPGDRRWIRRLGLCQGRCVSCVPHATGTAGPPGAGAASRMRGLCCGPGPPPQAAGDLLSLAVDHVAFSEISFRWTRAASILTSGPLQRAPFRGGHLRCCVCIRSLASSLVCVDCVFVSPVVSRLGLLETFVCVCVSVWMHVVSLLEDCLKVEQLGHVVSLLFRYFSFLSAVFCQFDKQVFHILCQFYP